MLSLLPFLQQTAARLTARSAPVLLGVTFALGVASAPAQTAASSPPAAGRVRMSDSFRAVAPAGQASAAMPAETVRDALTAAEASAPMEIQLPLRTRNAAELERRVAAGETISREEMAARFLPTADDFQAVAAWLTAQGLTVRPAGASHAIVIATGTPAQLEKAFEAHFARVKAHGEEYTSTTVAPTVPAEIEARVSAIHGLQPHLRPHKTGSVKQAATNGAPPYYVGDILNAYDVTASGLTGAGQTIGIIIDTLPLTSDLTHFWATNGLAQNLGNYSSVNVENSSIGPPTGEETLDTEWSSGIASGAKIVVYACGDLSYCNDAYSRVLDDLQGGAQTSLHQISISFGSGEISDETQDDMNSVHAIFTSIAAYGVSIFASSGDEGAYGNDEGIIEALFPASDPLVTGVGGTTLELTSTDVVHSESGWSSDGSTHDSSGGGYSVVFDLPTWQTGEGVKATAMRQVPDVSLDADPATGGYVYLNGRPTGYGGTSWATPCWAGLCALINQSRATQKLPALVGMNAAIYPLLGTPAFRDITNGYNVAYNCTPGYDLVTGIGVPDFNVLYKNLDLVVPHPGFFQGEAALANAVFYLAFSSGNPFGYYSYLSDPHYLYHFDLGYEYWFDAKDGKNGIYFYDFESGDYFYTSPSFPFPYLYDFALKATLYYYPDTNRAGHYSTGPRYFYNFATNTIITR